MPTLFGTSLTITVPVVEVKSCFGLESNDLTARGIASLADLTRQVRKARNRLLAGIILANVSGGLALDHGPVTQ